MLHYPHLSALLQYVGMSERLSDPLSLFCMSDSNPMQEIPVGPELSSAVPAWQVQSHEFDSWYKKKEIPVMWKENFPSSSKELFKEKMVFEDFFSYYLPCFYQVEMLAFSNLVLLATVIQYSCQNLKSALIECVWMLSLHNSLNWKTKCFTSLLDIHSKLFNFRRKKNHMFSCIVNFRPFHMHCIKTAISILMYRFCKYYAICNT